MSNVSQPEAQPAESKLANALTVAFGLACIPLVALVSPRTVIRLARDGTVTLRTEANQAYFDEIRVVNGADAVLATEIVERLKAQIDGDR